MPQKNRHYLCRVDELPENSTKGFSVGEDDAQTVFVVRRDNYFYAYQNQCPHTRVELNWLPDQFMDIENFYIQCSVHGALFQVEDGLCVRGPCANQSLTPVEVEVANGEIFFIR